VVRPGRGVLSAPSFCGAKIGRMTFVGMFPLLKASVRMSLTSVYAWMFNDGLPR